MLYAKQICVSTAMFGPTVTTYFNLLHFRPEKRVSGALRPKGPELGMVITTLAQCVCYHEYFHVFFFLRF